MTWRQYNMLSLTFLLTNLKAIIVVAVSLIFTIFGVNYVRRGKKIDSLEQDNKVLKTKDELKNKQENITSNMDKQIKEVDNVKKDDIIDKLNSLDK